MRKKLALIVLLVVAIFGFIKFNHQTTKNSGEIRVGVILPLTGQYGALGESIKKSMEMEQSMSTLGTNIKLFFEDDKYDAKVGLSAYRKLTGIDQSDIIIAISSPTVEIIKPIIKKTDKLMFVLGEELTHENDNVFQVMPAGIGLYKSLGELASKHFEKISVVYASDNKLFVTDGGAFMKGLSSNVKFTESPVLSTSDMKTEVTKVIGDRSQAFTLFMPVEAGIKFLSELRKYPTSYRPMIICDINIELALQQYEKAVGADVFNGCLSTAFTETKTKEFVSLYKEKYASDPQFASDFGFDTIKIVDQLSSMEATKRVDFLNKNFSHSGMSGTITFDETGARPTKWEQHTFTDGSFKKVTE